ncbi:hypothetical protein FPF71_03070 [Algibacter amylolyticus]|uniref:Lipoprotein n=1 Tax=Algibacter amylolyticus TaxID=1608400 RepID=A0A5M7BLX9_9FLAO|nr:hypothetical protein [Algibacter amylolyticus]KAA5827835.1 hypothetical protein F2B50_03070 [Algibacter amylolyticus]MBB5267064.1 hypothetical protein [Algibacter amylolyticus]TSJ82080.1 hypothetical protein FPF71_03070 [Algibacter amylolyticus]
MKKLILILIVIPLITLNTTSCKNDDDVSKAPIDQLPPKTQTGENTFGYLVNGKPVVVSNTRKITAIYQQNQLQLGGGVENDNIDIDIVMFVGGPIEENTPYSLVEVSKYTDFNILDKCKYNIEDAYEGSIMFSKIDKVNYIISGAFSFSIVTDNCEDIKITNGRFDVKYTP